MSSRNRSYTIQQIEDLPDLKTTIKQAIYNNSIDYLNPPIKNIGYKGIAKTASEIKKWFKESHNIKRDFQTTSRLMERAGTGGALFRNLYRDFLKESYQKLENLEIENAYIDFREIAKLWSHVSELFFKVGETEDIRYINEASKILTDLSEREKRTMSNLHKYLSN